MQGNNSPSSPRPLFVGRRGGRAVWFICSNDGTFGIHCGAERVAVWPAGELDEALRAYLDFVERPALAGGPPATPPPPNPFPAVRRLPERPARAGADVPPDRERARECRISAA
jgi:hypothetical protein